MNADTVTGLLSTSTVSELEFIRLAPASFVTYSTSLYAQDVWKLTRRMVLTYGLRWEVEPAPSPRNGTKTASWTNTDDPSLIALAPFGTPLWKTTWANLAPRLGISWKPTAREDLVIRGGIGLFYDLGTGRAADAAAFFPNSANRVVLNAPLPINGSPSDLPSLSVAPPYPLVNAFSPNLELPRSWEWNFAMEKAFSGHQIVTATYVGQHGQDLLRQEAEYRPNPSFSSAFLLTDNSAWSNYNALELQYRASLSGRLQALVNYTWSHSLDNSSSDVVAGASNTVISAADDYASSDFDVRQSFSGALTFAIPSAHGPRPFRYLSDGWSFAPVVVVRSGFPFNCRDQSLSPATGGYAYTRPDLVAGQPIWIPNSDAGGGKSLNPAAFSVPSTVRQGTEGRNDIQGFGLAQADLSLGRTFPIVENWHLKFQADAFNAAQSSQLCQPSGHSRLRSCLPRIDRDAQQRAWRSQPSLSGGWSQVPAALSEAQLLNSGRSRRNLHDCDEEGFSVFHSQLLCAGVAGSASGECLYFHRRQRTMSPRSASRNGRGHDRNDGSGAAGAGIRCAPRCHRIVFA